MRREIFRAKDLPELLNCGKTLAGELRTDPTFPKLFPLTAGGRGKFGFMDELTAWLEARATKAAPPEAAHKGRRR
jgi:hypothetical protein